MSPRNSLGGNGVGPSHSCEVAAAGGIDEATTKAVEVSAQAAAGAGGVGTEWTEEVAEADEAEGKRGHGRHSPGMCPWYRVVCKSCEQEVIWRTAVCCAGSGAVCIFSCLVLICGPLFLAPPRGNSNRNRAAESTLRNKAMQPRCAIWLVVRASPLNQVQALPCYLTVVMHAVCIARRMHPI